MRTLFISPYVPEPVNSGGSQRIFHMLRAVARVSEVTFLSAAADTRQDYSSASFYSCCKDVILFSRDSQGWERDHQLSRPVRWARKIGRHFGSREPVLLQWFHSREAVQLLQELCTDKFDLIWVETILMLNLLRKDLPTRVIVDIFDLEHQKLERQLRVAKPGREMIFDYWELLKLRRFERELSKLSHDFVFCSETDKQLAGCSRAWVMPNGVTLPAHSGIRRTEPSDPVLTFVGLMDYAPNVDGVQFFVREIWPLIQREVPAARFVIVGRDPTPAVQQLASHSGVTVTGTVPDVASYLYQSSIVVVPLRVGSGTRFKIPEAMAHGRPVVSTTIGAEGLAIEPGKHLLIEDSPARFAEACVRLLREPGLARTLVEQGLDLVRTTYDWSNIEEAVGEIALGHSTKKPPSSAQLAVS